MRFIIGFLSGVLGALAGWFGLAMLVIGLSGPDRDGGIAMGAFFNIGPLGAVVGFVAGVLLFLKFGRTREPAPSTEAGPPAAPRRRVSRPFAIVVVAMLAGLAWWAWYELIRSPYLTHGFMTLEMQFRLPVGMALPADPAGVRITVHEGGQYLEPGLGPGWHGSDEGRRVILAHVTLSMKTGRRSVSLEMPGVASQTWTVALASDPEPMSGFTEWRLSGERGAVPIEMNYRLTAEH
ncbi:MAG: hypothetical protein JSR61_09170 [Proteobacteria bacterium]|nr:hypothetical protein [Pseudomonadota bacterium]